MAIEEAYYRGRFASQHGRRGRRRPPLQGLTSQANIAPTRFAPDLLRGYRRIFDADAGPARPHGFVEPDLAVAEPSLMVEPRRPAGEEGLEESREIEEMLARESSDIARRARYSAEEEDQERAAQIYAKEYRRQRGKQRSYSY